MNQKNVSDGLNIPPNNSKIHEKKKQRQTVELQRIQQKTRKDIKCTSY